MQLKEIDMRNKFMTIIKADYRDADYIEKEYTFSNNQFEEIIAFLTIIQDIYNKKNDLKTHFKYINISKSLDQFVRIYFEKYANFKIEEINQFAEDWIIDNLYDLMPKTNDYDYRYPRTIEYIKIIKDSKVYLFEKNQSDNDIKQAQNYIINWLKNV